MKIYEITPSGKIKPPKNYTMDEVRFVPAETVFSRNITPKIGILNHWPESEKHRRVRYGVYAEESLNTGIDKLVKNLTEGEPLIEGCYQEAMSKTRGFLREHPEICSVIDYYLDKMEAQLTQ
jgi:hypothetical protein